LDDLAEFEEFRNDFLKVLRKDLAAGLSPTELRNKYKSLVQARQLAIALTSEDTNQAAQAAQKILDRQEGKATEKQEVQHKFEQLPDEELDAVIQGKLNKLRSVK